MIFGLAGVFIGLALGVVAGVWGGCRLFEKYFEQLDVGRFDIRSDYDDKVPIPKVEGRPVPRKYRAFLPYLPNWATMPDFHRVTWANHILRTLWPYYNQAIGKMILQTVKPQIDSITSQYPFVEAIDVELIDFGTKPMRVAGVKVYNSVDDEVIMETPLAWGSNARFRMSTRLRFSKWSFYIPLEISNFQMKVTARSTLRPLVDTLPCMGAVTVTLTDPLYLDFSLHLFSNFDLMLLPGIREIALYTIKGVIGDMVQYPNKMTFDIMEGGGVPPPPVGLLQIKVEGVEGISGGGDLLSKVDPYLELGVRENRAQRTKTVWNNKHPRFDEVFNLIVDDIDSQTLTFKLHDDDLGFNDPVIGIAEVDLAGSEFIRTPQKRAKLNVDFVTVPAMKKMKRLVKKSSRNAHRIPTGNVDEHGNKQYKIPEAPSVSVLDSNPERKSKARVGTLHAEVLYVPFKESEAPEPEPDRGQEAQHNANGNKLVGFTRITDDDKGILTVTLSGCTNLSSSDGDVDPYVTLTIQDPQHTIPETQISSQMHNEPNPHWSQKFDFAMISATSLLVLKVYDKKSTMQNMLHNPVKVLTGKVKGKTSETDECIGTLRIKVRDVVRNERIKDVWALQETQKGEAHLALEWRPIVLEKCDELLPAGDLQEQQKRLEEQEKAQEQEHNEQPAKSSHSHLHLPHFHLPHRKDKEKVKHEKQQDSH